MCACGPLLHGLVCSKSGNTAPALYQHRHVCRGVWMCTCGPDLHGWHALHCVSGFRATWGLDQGKQCVFEG